MIEKRKKAQEHKARLQKYYDVVDTFQKDFRENDIETVKNKIDTLKDGNIKEFDKNLDIEFKGGIEKIDKIYELKDCSIFKKLYDKASGQNLDEKFESTLKELPEEINKIRNDNKKISQKDREKLKAN